jgi:hypothetical protein
LFDSSQITLAGCTVEKHGHKGHKELKEKMRLASLQATSSLPPLANSSHRKNTEAHRSEGKRSEQAPGAKQSPSSKKWGRLLRRFAPRNDTLIDFQQPANY